jgi:hypothetical protein
MKRLILKLFRRRHLHEDLEKEMAFHREMSVAAGNPIPFGNPDMIKEQALDLWRFTVAENLWRDLRFERRARRPLPSSSTSRERSKKGSTK